jgi:hypothetical protein
MGVRNINLVFFAFQGMRQGRKNLVNAFSKLTAELEVQPILATSICDGPLVEVCWGNAVTLLNSSRQIF